MKRQWKIALCLAMVLAALSGCSDQGAPSQVFEEVTQFIGPAATDPPQPQPNNPPQQNGGSIFANNPYDIGSEDYQGEEDYSGAEDYTGEDALGEEDWEDGGYEDTYDEGASAPLSQAYDPDATLYPYAGSTPIPLDPVDMPPPPTQAPLVFAFMPYDIPSLGLSF